MQHIETIELGSSQSSITFSSIPQDYDDLVVYLSSKGDRSDVNAEFVVRFNSSTTNFSNVILFGRGSTVGNGSNTTFDGFSTGQTATANTFSNSVIYIANYTSSVAKSYSIDGVTENNATQAYQNITAGLWDDTSAITSVVLDSSANTANFLAGSTASLYGITAGEDGTVTTS